MGRSMGDLDRGGGREGIANSKVFLKPDKNIRLAQSGLERLLKGKRENTVITKWKVVRGRSGMS